MGLYVRRTVGQRIFFFDSSGKCIGSVSVSNSAAILDVSFDKKIKVKREEVLTPAERRAACSA